MQAIVTKFLGPTNHRGSRIVARADAGTMTVAWNHSLGQQENHEEAARQLREKLGWTGDYGRLVSGGLPGDAGYAHVFVATVGA